MYDFFAEKFPFWEHLTEQQKKLLCDNTEISTYQKGELLQQQETQCRGLILVKSGQLRVYLLSEDGREVTLYRLYENDICVLSASCVLDEITFDVSIEVIADTELITIGAPILHQLAKENIYVESFGYRLATERFSDVMWTMQQILFMGIDKRLAVFLADEISKSKSNEIHMTQEQIAKYIGTAREVVSRMLKYFANEGIVESFRGGIRICDKQKLYQYLS